MKTTWKIIVNDIGEKRCNLGKFQLFIIYERISEKRLSLTKIGPTLAKYKYCIIYQRQLERRLIIMEIGAQLDIIHWIHNTTKENQSNDTLQYSIMQDS